MNYCDVIIFSKDRPMQLYALLESFEKYCKDIDNLNIEILYKDSYNQNLYDNLITKFNSFNFISETTFNSDLNNLINKNNSKYIMFLVDDIIFKNLFAIKECITFLENNNECLSFSLRLGTNINYCYPISTNTPILNFKCFENDIITWKIKGIGDWGYPFSLDGNIYRTQEFNSFYSIIQNNYKCPNTLEFKLSNLNIGDRFMSAFKKSKLINVPHNKVQNYFINKNEKNSHKFLIEKWIEGYKININELDDIQNNSCHFPVDFKFIKR